MTQDTKAPERIWAWCWNYVGPFDGKPAWSSFKPSFDHLFKTEVVETSWNPLNKRFWIQKRKVPDQMVFEYARLDLLTAAEARAEAAEAERDRLAALVAEALDRAIADIEAKEREACAKVADDIAEANPNNIVQASGMVIAAAIRARGEG